MIRLTLLAAMAVLSGCGAHASRQPAMEMRFFATPAESAPTERVSEKLSLNVTVISDSTLQHVDPVELLKLAETPRGTDAQKLLRAARTLVPGTGVVLLGTVRSNEDRPSAANRAIYTLALRCGAARLDSPGDLTGCQGYLLRIPREGQGTPEVYGIEKATVSLIPDGSTALGRLRAKSVPGGFKAEVDGDFSASIVELGVARAVATSTGGR
jgi:hypothetical protein